MSDHPSKQMNPNLVPDELVDRARKAWVASATSEQPGHGMAHALAAVIPAIQAAALRDAADAWQQLGAPVGLPAQDSPISRWLQRRADQLDGSGQADEDAHACGNCDGIDPASCATRPAAEDELPDDAQDARPDEDDDPVFSAGIRILRRQIADRIRDYQTRHMVVCEHTQLISYGGAADAVLPVIQAALTAYRAEARQHRARAEQAERERDQAIASLTKYAAEAHRRKWDHADDNQPAFDALHRLGDEILASRDRVLATLDRTAAGK